MRSRLLSLPYGDRAIFLNKQTFEDIVGFADLPTMENFELVQMNEFNCLGYLVYLGDNFSCSSA